MTSPRFTRLSDITAELANVDNANVLERMKNSPALLAALEMYRPRNWWGLGMSASTVIRLAADDGIPIAWVPRREIIAELLKAETAIERSTVLLTFEDDILEDCSNLLDECNDPWLSSTTPLAGRVIDTHRAGFHEASTALAVSLAESLALWASQPPVPTFSSEADEQAWRRKIEGSSRYGVAKLELAATQKRSLRCECALAGACGAYPNLFHLLVPTQERAEA